MGFVRVLKKSKPKTAQESKQKQFHVRKSYKTHESTLPCIGNSEENIDLSCIYLAGQMNAQPKTFFAIESKFDQIEISKEKWRKLLTFHTKLVKVLIGNSIPIPQGDKRDDECSDQTFSWHSSRS